MNTLFLFLIFAVVALLAICTLPAPNLQRPSSRHYRGPSTFRRLAGRFMLRLLEALVIPARLWARFKYRKLPTCYGANVAEGRHAESVSRLTDAAITTRHLLYTVGSDADHIAVAGASDIPIGTVADEATAAEESVTLDLLGKGNTKRMIASEQISAGDVLYVAAGGKVATTGTYIVGNAITDAAADGDIVEVADAVTGSVSAGMAATLFDAHTILYATTDNTPAALTIAASRIVGRKASGNISALTGAETRTVIMGVDNITATPVAAAGSTVADAGQLAASAVVLISSDGATKGVKLPTGVAGMVIDVINTSSTAAELYAAAGGTVNGGSADASVVVPASKGVRCFCTAADTWLAFDMTAAASAS